MGRIIIKLQALIIIIQKGQKRKKRYSETLTQLLIITQSNKEAQPSFTQPNSILKLQAINQSFSLSNFTSKFKYHSIVLASMRASRNVLMMSREGGSLLSYKPNNLHSGGQSIHHEETNPSSGGGVFRRTGTTFKVNQEGDLYKGEGSIFESNFGEGKARQAKLYREIASREQPRRSPRQYSQALPSSKPFKIERMGGERESRARGMDVDNTFSEVHTLIRGMFSQQPPQSTTNQMGQEREDPQLATGHFQDQKTEMMNPSEQFNGRRQLSEVGSIRNENPLQSKNTRSREDLYESLANLNVDNIRRGMGQQHRPNQASRATMNDEVSYPSGINLLFQQEVDERNVTIARLKDTNEELNSQLGMLAQRLDELMLKVRQKQLQDDKTIQKLSECGHEQQIERLQKQIADREGDIAKIKNRMEAQLKLKEREISLTQEKIQQSKKELVHISKRAKMTEADRVVDLEQKIQAVEGKNKDLEREIKALKRLQHEQGNQLVGLQNTEDYPEKIKSLMEEVRWAKDKSLELEDKLKSEEKLSWRQKEQLLNLEGAKQELELRYRKQVMKLGVREGSEMRDEDELGGGGVGGANREGASAQSLIEGMTQMPELTMRMSHIPLLEYRDIDQVQLLNKIIQLEELLQGRTQENKLIKMKMKELAGDKQLQGHLQMEMIRKMSPRRQAKSAGRNQQKNYLSGKVKTAQDHNKPFSTLNNTVVNIEEGPQLLKKKKSINEHYSFLLGKDRSQGKLRTQRQDSKPRINKTINQDLPGEYGYSETQVEATKQGKLILPSMKNQSSRNLSNPYRRKQILSGSQRDGAGSFIKGAPHTQQHHHQYYTNFQSLDHTPKINVLQPLNSLHQSLNAINKTLDAGRSPYKSVRSSSKLSRHDKTHQHQTLHLKATPSKGRSLNRSGLSGQNSESRKRVGFSESINERDPSPEASRSLLKSSPGHIDLVDSALVDINLDRILSKHQDSSHNTLSQDASIQLLQQHNSHEQQHQLSEGMSILQQLGVDQRGELSQKGLINYTTDRRIRRVKDLEEIGLSNRQQEIQINLENDTDQILQDLKSNLKNIF